MDKMPEKMDAEPEMVEADEGSDVTEEYISSVQNALGKVIPEDFSSLGAEIPTDAADGERVAMIVTGYAEGGKVVSPFAAKVDLSEPKPKGRMMKMFNSKEA